MGNCRAFTRTLTYYIRHYTLSVCYAKIENLPKPLIYSHIARLRLYASLRGQTKRRTGSLNYPAAIRNTCAIGRRSPNVHGC